MYTLTGSLEARLLRDYQALSFVHGYDTRIGFFGHHDLLNKIKAMSWRHSGHMVRLHDSFDNRKSISFRPQDVLEKAVKAT